MKNLKVNVFFGFPTYQRIMDNGINQLIYIIFAEIEDMTLSCVRRGQWRRYYHRLAQWLHHPFG